MYNLRGFYGGSICVLSECLSFPLTFSLFSVQFCEYVSMAVTLSKLRKKYVDLRLIMLRRGKRKSIYIYGTCTTGVEILSRLYVHVPLEK